MLIQAQNRNDPPIQLLPRPVGDADRTRETPTPGAFEESGWRRPPEASCQLAAEANILISRWLDGRTSQRHEQAVSPEDRYVVSLSLRPTRMRLLHEQRSLVEGPVQAGTLFVCAPGQVQRAEFGAPCDFLHLYVAADYLGRQLAGSGAAPARDLNGFVAHDGLAADLGRTIIQGGGVGNWLFAQCVAQAIVMRMLALHPCPSRMTQLPKWRLRRVESYIAANIGEPISLGDLAEAAGLSRMHFAAQFRAATGCSPHEYLLQQRIECAKSALAEAIMPLAEVALSVGFQTQSHFSTVFKRFTGETPGRWQRGCRRE